jgi:hypothetical protein
LEGYEIDPGIVVFKYEGLHTNAEYYSPDYSNVKTNSGRMPDFRSVLYWAPQVPLSNTEFQQISFFTSDLGGQFIVVVQGICPDGEACFATTRFTLSP